MFVKDDVATMDTIRHPNGQFGLLEKSFNFTLGLSFIVLSKAKKDRTLKLQMNTAATGDP